ncbi:hypothetical protein [Leptolyngbya sp. FACHB-261]|uniref:hypothetical protein n=1 Tax=Leptolyngbya sp. FACHB-261 TaxID=2692806 RepID=UPI0018EFBD88|nr:hypothetical protein [Leptolyngbya sp. FACHB-261]
MDSSNHSGQIVRLTSHEVLRTLSSGKFLSVDSRRKNGLIICKQYHAEFAGPGAAVGGFFDADCHEVIPVGDLNLVAPETYEERQKAYKIRIQWMRLTHQATTNDLPLQRARTILSQFEAYFDAITVAQLPDDILARLVGVLPQTIRQARPRQSENYVSLISTTTAPSQQQTQVAASA